MKVIFKKFLVILILAYTMLGFSGEVFAQNIAGVQELELIQQETLDKLDIEQQQSRDELHMTKQKEIEAIQCALIPESEKQELILRIEEKYRKLEKRLEKSYRKKRESVIDYYTDLKKKVIAAQPPPPPPPKTPAEKLHEKHVVKQIVPPQKLVDSWRFRSSYRYLGTLKFSNVEGVLVGAVYFHLYNKWDDIINLTYDGENIAFDYVNPYGVNLHFEGTINLKATKIKGKFVDMKTEKIHSWKAFR